MAAAWQSAIGNVVAGSLFATLQSLTMTRQLLLVGGALVVVGAIGMAGAAEWAKGVDWASGVDWVKGADWTEWVKAAGLTGVIVEQWASSVNLAHAMRGADGGLEANGGGGQECRLGGSYAGRRVGREGGLGEGSGRGQGRRLGGRGAGYPAGICPVALVSASVVVVV